MRREEGGERLRRALRVRGSARRRARDGTAPRSRPRRAPRRSRSSRAAARASSRVRLGVRRGHRRGRLASSADGSMPRRPRRSTTLAAPPPVVVTTATRGARFSSNGPSARKQRRDLEQRLEHVDAHDAAVAEVRVERAIGAGERAGVRARQRLAQRRAAELVGDDRLAGGVRRRAARGEARRIAHRLQEEQDHARVGVRRRAARPARRRRGRPRCRPRPAWRSPGRAPRRARAACRASVPLCETRLVPPAGSASISSTALTVSATRPGHVDHAHAVRPEQPHAERACPRDEARLALGALGARRRRSRRCRCSRPARRLRAQSSSACSTSSIMMKAWSTSPGTSATLR